MSLLKLPEPQLARRKYSVRLEEPLVLAMERYAVFLGAKTVDHVIAEALEFVFKKDSDFKEWLTEHTEALKRRQGRRKSKSRDPNTQTIDVSLVAMNVEPAPGATR